MKIEIDYNGALAVCCIEPMDESGKMVNFNDDGTIDIKRRLGCMGCPMASYKKRLEEFKQYPNMVKLYCNRGGAIP